MASAALPAALPRSKFSAGISSTNSAPTTATTADEAAAQERVIDEWRAAEDPEFAHPDHVIPPRSYSGIDSLIIVCCHAVFLPDAESSDFPLHSPHYEPNWLLAPFQKSDLDTGKPGEHETFLAHIKAGLDALTLGTDSEHPPSSLLVFSGGVTKLSQSSTSEARSYYHAALAEELVKGHLHGGRAHQMFHKGYVLLEEQATDSFQNLLFSLVLFKKATGRYPKNIRVVTHAFKAKRFLELHAPAIRWPKERLQVQGIDPVMSSSQLESTLQGEEQYGYGLWLHDSLGTGKILSEKRKQRGWDVDRPGTIGDGLDDSIMGLMRGSVPDQLPWEPRNETKPTQSTVSVRDTVKG